MTNQTPPAPPPTPPPAKVKKHVRFSPIWLIPILVGLVVLYVGYDAVKRRGRTLTLTFISADGLVPGETPIRHKNVQLGTVEDVRLSDDLSHVVVKVHIERHESSVLTDHARFWVVRPRFNGSVSNLTAGLETLVSGAYIAVDPGVPGGRDKDSFTGLEEPPGVRSDEPGRVFNIQADRLGSIGAGSAIYFHEVVVGEVLTTNIGDGHSPVNMRIFIRAPFDAFVVDTTRFWNISGLAINMGPDGLRVELQSVQAVIAGGIVFDSPKDPPGHPVKDSTYFPLYQDKATADAAGFQTRIPCVTYFKSSVAGLAVGAPVQMLGSSVGIVRDVRIVSDSKRAGGWLARIAFDVQPERIGTADTAMTNESLREHPPKVFLDSISFLTGQKVLTLDFGSTHEPKPGEIGAEGDAIVLPGEAGGIENVTVALGHIAGKIEQIPFDDIGKNLDSTLRSLDQTIGSKELQDAVKELSATMADVHKLVQQTDQNLTPALAKLPAMAEQLQQAITNANHAFGESGYGSDSDFQRNMSRLMKQVAEAARSIRVLADFLDRHPESLLRGRSEGSEK